MAKFLLAGASGFLGHALRTRLATEGHEVVRLVRREPATATEFRWDPVAGTLDPAALEGVDAVVNLGGVGVFTGLWTQKRRKAILASRLQVTSTISTALADLAGPKPVLLSASGIARYGTVAGPEPFTEDSPAADDFLAHVTVQWEAATQPALDAGVRTVFLRTSPVLDRTGSAFRPMKLAWSVGGGAVLGDGHQHMPMISLEDYLGVVLWAAGNSHAAGPYNLTIPEPTTNRAFTDELAKALGRPRVLAVPAGVLRAALGELAEQLVGDMYVVPHRLTADGYRFVAPDVTSTIATALRSDVSGAAGAT